MHGQEVTAVAVSVIKALPHKFMQNDKIQMKHHSEKQINANITSDVVLS